MNRIICYIALCLLLAACSNADKQLRRGDAHWALGEYDEAAYYYRKAYAAVPAKERKKRGAVAYKMGLAFERLRYTRRALAGFEGAVRYQYTDTNTWVKLGYAQLENADAGNARKSFKRRLDSLPDDHAARVGLASADLQEASKGQPSAYTVRAADVFNSRRSDFSPTLAGDNAEQLFLTSTRQQAAGDDLSPITGMKYSDVFVARKDEKGVWKQPEPVLGLNTPFEEGVTAISPDGRTLYLTVCTWDATYPRMAQIYTSARADASWGKPQPLKISADTLSSYAHPAPSPDGRWLYFVSDLPGGYGGYDLWRAQLNAKGVAAIENLGASINTAGNELFPSFRPNGDLYFSSDGRIGLGGLDLYCARLDTARQSWQITHLPRPMNSPADDFGMTFEGIHHRGFFSSNRDNGRGWDKIYAFEYAEVVQTVKGWVYEQDGYELPRATVYLVGDDGTNLVLSVKSDGSFEQVIRPHVNYIMMATCEGFLNYSNELRVDSSAQSQEHVLQFPLPSINVPVLVRNVFYEFDSAQLTDSSRTSLDKLTALLKENAHVTIELASHTDHRGADAYNQSLSQRRAESVVAYLTKHGIAPARLSAKGYGESVPKIINKKLAEQIPFVREGDTLTASYISRLTPEQQELCHALNRRTEFRVLRTTYGLFDEQGKLKPQAVRKNENE